MTVTDSLLLFPFSYINQVRKIYRTSTPPPFTQYSNSLLNIPTNIIRLTYYDPRITHLHFQLQLQPVLAFKSHLQPETGSPLPNVKGIFDVRTGTSAADAVAVRFADTRIIFVQADVSIYRKISNL